MSAMLLAWAEMRQLTQQALGHGMAGLNGQVANDKAGEHIKHLSGHRTPALRTEPKQVTVSMVVSLAAGMTLVSVVRSP